MIRRPLIPTLLLFLLLLLLGGYLHYFTTFDVNWPAYWVMLVFYGVIFFAGAYAANMGNAGQLDDMMLAGRSLPLTMAIFTMSATWIGGGYINGTAEYTASQGLVWVQAPWGYALSLVVGGLLFARPMRRRQFRTMLDPLEMRFGKRATALFFLPALTGEIFWTGAILTALGTTFGTVFGLETATAIIMSALVAIAYTAIGGLWSVAFTDIIQLILLLAGLFLVTPFALDKVGGWSAAWPAYQERFGAAASLLPSSEALGSYYWYWWDYAFLLIFGGVAWQVYFQRVLSARSERAAVTLSLAAGVVCLVAAVPSVLIGIAGAVADWKGMGLQDIPEPASTLPWVVRYLTSPWVAALGLGAVAAAVMSSVDSSILSASSMAAWNVWRPLVQPQISEDRLVRVIKRSVWIIGIAATLLALNIRSVYELWFLCSDFVYCLLFPALTCAIFDKKANVAGALAGFAGAFILRFGGGDTTLGLPVLLPYPMVEDGVVLFPFRTLAMAANFLLIISVSRKTQRRFPARKFAGE
ncbi:MAG TPA: sodium:solute symporter family protein [Flavilitoribacter sp.]|nr:sodium:solute symporter family protein [Flavilitoribacter sp.]